MEDMKKEAIAPIRQNNNKSTSPISEKFNRVQSELDRANCRIKAANTLAERSEQLSQQLLELLPIPLNDVPQVLQEIKYCISLISYCLISGNSEPIAVNLISEVKENPEAFWLSVDDLIDIFNSLRENHGLTDEAKDAANEYIEGAIGALTELGSELKIPEKSELLTLEEIKQRYPKQWVMIDYAEENEASDVIRGEVLAYSPNCDEIYDYFPNLNGREVAIEYTGPFPENEEILTLEEIKQRYPHEWVLIVEPEIDKYLNVIRGKVLAHSPDRDEAYSQFPLRQGKPVAIEYTGPIPDNLVVML